MQAATSSRLIDVLSLITAQNFISCGAVEMLRRVDYPITTTHVAHCAAWHISNTDREADAYIANCVIFYNG